MAGFLLYIIVLGIAVNLLASVIRQRWLSGDKRTDMFVSVALIIVLLLLAVYHRGSPSLANGQESEVSGSDYVRRVWGFIKTNLGQILVLLIGVLILGTYMVLVINWKSRTGLGDWGVQMLPQRPFDSTSFDIGLRSVPEEPMKGGFYWFYEGNDNLKLAIGDADRREIATVFQMGIAFASLGGHKHGESRIPFLIARLNDLACQYSKSGRQASLFYGVFAIYHEDVDPDGNNEKIFSSRTPGPSRQSSSGMFLNYCNAGYQTAILCRNQGPSELLASTSPRIGLYTKGFREKCDERFRDINEGDTLVLCTEGVAKAQNAGREIFGRQRLHDIVNTNRKLSSQELADEIYARVLRFSSLGVSQSDDITILVIKPKNMV
jgi:hypothetical protein